MKGWHFESQRHSLAARGIKTKTNEWKVLMEDHKLKDAVMKISYHPEVKEIYLFGSRIKGNNRLDSDYDLLVVSTDPELCIDLNWPIFDIKIITPEEMDDVLYAELHGEDIEIGDGNNLGWTMESSGLKERILLYVRNDK